MGKLYDKRDLEFDLDTIERMQQETSRQILAGTFPAMKARQLDELFEKERQRSKMQLLRTSQLVADLRSALGVFHACPHCATSSDGKQRACKAHAAFLTRAKRAIHWAAQDNLARRDAAGVSRGDDEAAAAHNGELNEWEAWYYSDRREGVWPGDTNYNLAQYGSLDYRGWLAMLLEEEEISYEDYTKEMQRLKGI